MSGEAPWTMSGTEQDVPPPVNDGAMNNIPLEDHQSDDAQSWNGTAEHFPQGQQIPQGLQCGGAPFEHSGSHQQFEGPPEQNINSASWYSQQNSQDSNFGQNQFDPSVVAGYDSTNTHDLQENVPYNQMNSGPFSDQQLNPDGFANNTISTNQSLDVPYNNMAASGIDSSSQYIHDSFDRSDPQGAGELGSSSLNDSGHCNGIGASGESTCPPQVDTPMMASSSFNNLPSEPSPFDNIGGQHIEPVSTESGAMSFQPPSIDETHNTSLGTPADVKFIVGGSGPPSSTCSPYPPFGGASPRDSPIRDGNVATTTTTTITSTSTIVTSSVATNDMEPVDKVTGPVLSDQHPEPSQELLDAPPPVVPQPETDNSSLSGASVPESVESSVCSSVPGAAASIESSGK